MTEQTTTTETEAVEPTTNELDDLRAKLKKANGEAKGHRLALKALREEHSTLQGVVDTQTADRELKSLESREEYDQARTKYETQIQAAKSERDTFLARVKEKLISQRARLALSKVGITDEVRQSVLMPGVVSGNEFEFDPETLTLTGDIDERVKSVVESLGLNQPAAPPEPKTLVVPTRPGQGQPTNVDDDTVYNRIRRRARDVFERERSRRG